MKRERDAVNSGTGRDLVFLKTSVVDAELGKLDLKLRTVRRTTRMVAPAAYEAGGAAGASLAINPGFVDLNYLVDLASAARAHALGRAEAVLSHDTSKELQPDEIQLIRNARLLQFTAAGVDWLPTRHPLWQALLMPFSAAAGHAYAISYRRCAQYKSIPRASKASIQASGGTHH